MDEYFVFSRCEDGVGVEVFSKAKLISLVNDNDIDGGIFDGVTFLEDLPDDFECFPANSAVVIKGKVISPTPVCKVTKFEIE